MTDLLRKAAVLFVAVSAVCAGQQTAGTEAKRPDPWAKVHDLKSGTELRIIKKDSRQPILATYEDLSDDALIVATKKEEIGIPREQIERIDARPSGGSRVSHETRTTTTTDTALGPPTQNVSPGPTSSTSSSVNFGSKADFETVYRATAGTPTK